ncbi:hypothetical protein AC1031_015755 [Aphanomyces cochlioides]|nr:hypothetical protein AC1031_015755 [Aphanomyces cochlioides]
MALKSTLKLPIPDDFFQVPPLSDEQIDMYRSIGAQAGSDLIKYINLTGGLVDWTFHSKNETATMYASREADVPIFRVCTEIEASLEDVIALFLTPSTSETRQVLAAYLPLFIDKVRLYNLTLPTPENPHLFQSLCWSIARSPSRGVILKPRDWSFVEHMEEVMIDGRRAWYRSVTHAEIPGCPDLEAQYGVVRGQMHHTGYVYIETDQPGILEHIAVYHNQVNGKLTGPLGDFVLNKITEGHYRAIKDAEHVVRAYQLSRDSQMWHLPEKVFNEKDHCRRCAKVVCKKHCSKMWKFLKSGIQVRARVCIECTNEVKTKSLAPSVSSAPSETDRSSMLSDDEVSTEAFSSYTGTSCSGTASSTSTSSSHTPIVFDDPF